MAGRVAVEVVRNGQRGFQVLPDPPSGKGYIIVPVENELIDKVNTLDHNGHWERELSELLAREVELFFKTRRIEIRTPGTRAKREPLKLYDPRDPLRERLN